MICLRKGLRQLLEFQVFTVCVPCPYSFTISFAANVWSDISLLLNNIEKLAHVQLSCRQCWTFSWCTFSTIYFVSMPLYGFIYLCCRCFTIAKAQIVQKINTAISPGAELDSNTKQILIQANEILKAAENKLQ